MTQSRWRAQANSVIARVARENPDATGDELRKLINDAYPFGHRAYHPYKIWLDAVKEYMGLKVKLEKPARQSALDLGTDDLPLFAQEDGR